MRAFGGWMHFQGDHWPVNKLVIARSAADAVRLMERRWGTGYRWPVANVLGYTAHELTWLRPVKVESRD